MVISIQSFGSKPPTGNEIASAAVSSVTQNVRLFSYDESVIERLTIPTLAVGRQLCSTTCRQSVSSRNILERVGSWQLGRSQVNSEQYGGWRERVATEVSQ